MTELRRDNTRIILTADKGASLVVMNKEEYIEKAEELLNETTCYTVYCNAVPQVHWVDQTFGWARLAMHGSKAYPMSLGWIGLARLYEEHKESIDFIIFIIL